MSWLSLFTGGLGATVQGVARGVATFTGDKVQREASAHDEQMAVMGQMGDEFQYRGDRNWFDSLIDGINRLPRPAMVFGSLGLIAWCIVDPVEFSIAMQALALVPDWLSMFIIGIGGAYFGGRMISQDMKMGKSATADQVRSVLALQNEVRGLQVKAPIPDGQFTAAMANTATPMSNAAIDEWNRRRPK